MSIVQKKMVIRYFEVGKDCDSIGNQPFGEKTPAVTRRCVNFPEGNCEIDCGLDLIACAANCMGFLRIQYILSIVYRISCVGRIQNTGRYSIIFLFKK